MSSRLKKILLYGIAYPAFFLFSLVLGAYWTFPYDHVRDFIVQEAERSGQLHLEIASLEPSWLTGVDVEGVRIAKPSNNPDDHSNELVIQSASARISLLALLGGTQDVSYDVTLMGAGKLAGEVAQSETSLHVVSHLENVNLARIGPMKEAVGLPITGRVNGDVDLTIAQQAADTEGTANITINGLSVGDGETPVQIDGLGSGGLTLARMNLGTLRLRLATEHGVSSIEQLHADGEHAELWGTGSLRLTQPLRMSSMDMLVRVKFKDAYRNSSDRMSALFTLLDMNPQVRPARTPDDSLQWRVQGAFAGRVRAVPSGNVRMEGVD